MRSGQLLAALVVSTALTGCGGDKGSGTTKTGGDPPPAKKVAPGADRSAPPAAKTPRPTGPVMSTANFARIRPGTPVNDVVAVFGPAEDSQSQGGGTTLYTWGPKGQQLSVSAKNGVVEFVRWPGSDEFFKRRQMAFDNVRELAVLFTDHALVSGNRLPAKFSDLKSKREPSPQLVKLIAAGEIVAPWGESANQLVWGWWKDTPEFGGPYARYDEQRFEYAAPDQFKALRATKLSTKTVPEEHTKDDITNRGEPGFFLATSFMTPLHPYVTDPKLPPPRSLADYPYFMIRDGGTYAAVKAVETGAVVVRWDGHPAKGLYLHNQGFETRGGWAIWDTQFYPCATAADAARLLERK